MSIYRGAGGSGDAVNDASSEATLVAQLATEAQTSATNAATSATSAGNSATSATNSATSASNSATAAATSATNAANSASTATTQATNAANSATAAQTAETAAELAETNAETAQAAAASSASAASTSASNAATSATNASNSATAAATSATNASNSASAASTSATNAASSASSASTSATNASSSATAAAGSATAAAGSATSAAGSATTATTQAGIATTQATNAASSASAAATSATNAAASATTATTQAGIATTQATNAASSATSAAASLDSFDDRYLGAKASAPTLDNDGNALLNGALYFDSTLAAMRVYNTATSTWATIQQGVTNTDPVRHSVRPSLLLDFANTKTLDPRITFTRASTGTYYDGKTVAKAEENLFLYSEQFDNPYWLKFQTTVSANATTAPDGTTTADTLTITSGGAVYVSNIVSSGQTVSISIFAKAGTSSTLFIDLAASNNGRQAEFDLSAGTTAGVTAKGTGANVSGGTASIVSVGNGWYRCIITGLTTTATCSIGFGAATSQNFSLWGAQLEQRSSVTAYTATTTAPITNYIPALQTAAAGVARFEHNPVTGESLGLEIEDQRTNLFQRSEEFDNAYWSKTAVTILANTAISPDGALTADSFVENTTNTTHFASRTMAVTSGVSYTVTLFAKTNGRNIALFATGSLGGNFGRGFDLTNGTLIAAGNSYSNAPSSSITPVGNGWYRCSITVTSTATGNTDFGFWSLDSGGAGSYTGNGFSGAFVWGAQLEAGSFATSYIPTVASQVTRSADAASMTGTNFSSWYRTDEGTLYAEAIRATVPTDFARLIDITDGTVNNRNLLDVSSGNQRRLVVQSNGTNQAVVTGSAISANTSFKVSGTYKVNDFQLASDGSLATADTSGLVPSGVTQARFGSTFDGTFTFNGSIKKLAYYPKKLSNAEIQGLTTI